MDVDDDELAGLGDIGGVGSESGEEDETAGAAEYHDYTLGRLTE